MAKKETKDVQVINPELQKGLDVILSVKSELDEIGKSCMKINITDEATLSVAQQNLSMASSLIKTIEEKRKQIKEPYLQAGKLIDKTCSDMVREAELGVEHVKNQIKMWEIKRAEEAKKAQEELEAKQKKEVEEKEKIIKEAKEDQEFYSKVVNQLSEFYIKATTPEICQEKIDYITNNFPASDKFRSLASEAQIQKDNYIKMLQTKLEQLQKEDTLSEAEKQLIKEKEELFAQKQLMAQKEAELLAKEEQIKREAELKKAQEEAEAERLRVEAENNANKTRGVKYLWKFELVDKSKLSEDWITLDDEKAKEYLKANKDNIKDGEIINGVKFFKDVSVSA